MDRAYSVLEIRGVSEDARVIEGIASTPTADRMGDVVEPMGAKFALPMPLLWQHNHDEPVGQVEFAKPTKAGIPFKARIADPDDFESETLKERLRLAWDSIKGGLVRAVSIGFRALDYEVMKEGGYRFKTWEWLELSAVTIPANADATLTTIKAIDQELRGVVERVEPELQPEPEEPAASGKPVRVVRLNPPARGRAEPFIIRQIVRTK